MSLVSRAPRLGVSTSVTLSVSVLLVIVLATPSVESPSGGEAPFSAVTRENGATIPVFKDDTLGAGIAFSHLQGDERLTGINETLGAGACAFDYDSDGWVDLFLVNGTGETRYYGAQHWWHLAKGHALYRNLGGGRFEEVTRQAGLNARTWGMGCAAADFDNDGDADLLVTNYGGNLFYRNDGDGGFTDITEKSGITGEDWSTSAAVADFDGDGLLDLYITNYIEFEKGAHTYESASQFETALPRSFSPELYVAQPNRLYRNLGDLVFEDATSRAGVANASGRSLHAVWLDINGDMRPDILVGNGAGTTNVAYINRGNGRFEEAGARYLLNDVRGSNGFGIGDVNEDGFPDVAISTGIGEPPLVLINENNEDKSGRVFRNRTRNLEIGSEASSVFSGWGLAWRDFNNDGRLDLFQANGLVTPDPDTQKLPQGQPKRLWLQQAGGDFRDVTEQAGIALSDNQSARGLAIADFDNDGDLDIYVTHNNGLGQLLFNQTASSHWLGVELEGRRGNRDAIGAGVRLRLTDDEQQYATVDSGGFLSTNDRRLHFGLGGQTRVQELAVTWPDGSTTELRDLPADRYIKVVQGQVGNQVLVQGTAEIEKEPVLGLRVASARPFYRVQYLKWMVDEEGVSRGLPELRAALGDDDPHVRATAIRLLKQQKLPESFALVVGALEDADVEIRLEALEAVRQYENEASVRWLLRAFNDPDPRMRAAVADIFSYFFDKEEAVIYRKFLAVPYLIKLLEDPQTDVRQAAARALGAAERFRAIEPLIARLEDPAARVRAEAACSLGLIRDRKAVDALRATLGNSTQPPIVQAHALIALKRLDALRDVEIERRFSSARDLLDVMKVVFTDTQHGIVLDRNALLRSLDRLGHPTDPELKRLTIEVLEAAAGPAAIVRLEKFAGDPDPAIRERVYDALITVDRARRGSRYVQALMDASIEVREAMLRRLVSDRVAVPASVLLANFNHSSTRLAAIQALGGVSGQTAIDRLHQIAVNENEMEKVRTAAIHSLIPAADKAPPLPESMLVDARPPLRIAALGFWAARLPAYLQVSKVPTPLLGALQDSQSSVRDTAIDILLNRPEPWAVRYLISLVSDRQTDPDVRRRIVAGFGTLKDPRRVEQALLRIAGARQDPLRVTAIDALLRANSTAARELMWRILDDSSETDELRFLAAQGLQDVDGEAVLEKLRAG